jgi:flotillin
MEEISTEVVGVGIVGLGIASFALTRYRTSRSNQWLVRTGLGVTDIQIGKKYVQWPFQNIDYINMSPSSYKFSVNAMSKEKMEFNFPAVFTIGPRNNPESLTNFSRYLLNQDEVQTDNLIRGIIEGETRSLSANLSIEDIFTGRSEFKKDILESVQKQLDQYGLEIYNANIEELKDGDQSNYFKSLSQRIKSEAENRARVEVAEQNKKGEIGAKEREGETRQQVATIEYEAIRLENEKQQQTLVSKAELEKTRVQQEYIITQEKIQADNDALIKKMKMEKDVEILRSQMELEKQRANDLSTVQVKAEMEAKKAEGDANSQRILAEAHLYSKQKEAEAHLYAKLKEAEGAQALLQAQAQGLERLVSSFGGNAQALITYTMLEKGMFEKLAESNAKAIQGLNPKITVWTHDPTKAFDPIANLGKSLIPMVDTVSDQTGYKLPEWLIKKN